MVGYHLFTRQPKQKDDSEKPPATEQPTPPNPGDGAPADPTPKPADPASTAADPEPTPANPASKPVDSAQKSQPAPTPEPVTVEPPKPQPAPLDSQLLPPLKQPGRGSDWMRELYGKLPQEQKVCLSFPLGSGNFKKIHIMIAPMTDSVSRPCDALVNAANSGIGDGGGICGAIHSAYGNGSTGWGNDPIIQARKKSSKPNLSPGELLSHGGGKTGAQAIMQVLAPDLRTPGHQQDPLFGEYAQNIPNENEVAELRECYRKIGEELARLNGENVLICGLGEAIFAYSMIRAAPVAISETFGAYIEALIANGNANDHDIFITFVRFGPKLQLAEKAYTDALQQLRNNPPVNVTLAHG
jgi:O-acetyl-ADP-ribose deacetylase (regulator of RNase III)